MKLPSSTLTAVLLLTTCFASYHKAIAQNSTFSLVDNLNPVTPVAYQFVKYDQLPVSEYTGMPNISIPLYEIDEDGVKIPIDITYHASGIHVNEEASWVGLGWDLQMGSIQQQINDQDDMNPSENKLRPDIGLPSYPLQYPYKFDYAHCSAGGWASCLNGCTGLLPVHSMRVAEGYYIYTADYAPFGGDYGFSKPQNYENFFDSHTVRNIDSEPDIFTLNTPGTSIKFSLDWSYNGYQFIVLDKKGYSITYNGSNVLQVLYPSGDEYDFTRMNTVVSSSTSDGESGSGMFPGGASVASPSSVTWMLTKIITKNKKTIAFNYTVPAATYPVYPSYTQKGITAILTSNVTSGNLEQYINTFISGVPAATGVSSFVPATRSFSHEYYVTLNSIVFPNGQINFYTDSSRSDLMGGAKLDSVTVSNTFKVKAYYFNYSYFNASGVRGNTYNPLGPVNFGNYPLYRLRLDSLKDNSGARYKFIYNSTQLPAKNSYATDYWGYYNGRTSNTTSVPNGSQFVNSSLGIDYSAWGNDGDNHSANIAYTQAAMLTQITYPTGGSVNFNYELNQFNNYWVPDYSTSTNTISSGNGVRIKSIVWDDKSGNQLKQTNYTYSGGIAITPLYMFRQYNASVVGEGNVMGDSYPPFLSKGYTINESNMTGFFSSNPLGSINGVGYSQVTKTDVDNSGNPNGKEVQNYYNTPDLTFNGSVLGISQVDATLPAYKDSVHIDNGSISSDLFYDNSNNLLKMVSNTYVNSYSPILYGARLFGYGDLCTWNCQQDISGANEQQLWPQAMVGYYPIYDFESLLTGTTETDYYGSNAVTTTTTNTYDGHNQITNTSKTNSNYTEGTSYTYPYNYPSNTVLTAMTNANRLTDIVTANNGTPFGSSSFGRAYQQLGNLFVAAKDSTSTSLSSGAGSTPDRMTYDQYDSSNGNILQYSKNSVPNSVIWDYNKEEVIADVKNALYTNVAYTSFEADGTGRWKFTGTPDPDPASPTGQKVYSLSNGNIYRDSLDNTLTYIVSYWSKSGAQTVSGSGTTKQGYTFNGYTYYETTVTHPSGGTVTVSGTGTIDELRLYPNTAQMKSYTYAPLVGMTTESTEGGKIAYYEYDYAMRLLDIRDQNKNIIKAFCYNFAGQSTGCGLNITYSSQAQSQNFTRNNCSSGYVGSTLTYNVPLGKYTSTMSLDDANNQATEDMTANGQPNANTNGSCVIPPTITGIYYGGHGTGYTQVVFTTIPGCSTTVINYTDLTTNTPYTDAGGCTSPRYETLTVGHNYQFTITCYSSAFPSGITSAPYNYTPGD